MSIAEDTRPDMQLVAVPAGCTWKLVAGTQYLWSGSKYLDMARDPNGCLPDGRWPVWQPSTGEHGLYYIQKQ